MPPIDTSFEPDERRILGAHHEPAVLERVDKNIVGVESVRERRVRVEQADEAGELDDPLIRCRAGKRLMQLGELRHPGRLGIDGERIRMESPNLLVEQ